MAMLPRMLEEDRTRAGWSVGQVAWRLASQSCEADWFVLLARNMVFRWPSRRFVAGLSVD